MHREIKHTGPEADFTYDFHKHILLIVDLNQGNKTVTNDLPKVIDFIAKIEKVDLKLYKIAYRDSMGTWDEVVLDGKRPRAHHLGKRTEAEVIDHFMAIAKKKKNEV